MNAKKVLKAILPPILTDMLRFLQRGKFYGISGDFTSWEEAEKYVSKEYGGGYAADNILMQVLGAIQEVRAGHATFERDGVLFYNQEWNYPFLVALFYSLSCCSTTKGGHVNVLDFGGSLGSTFFQNRMFLEPFSCRWHIVEQPHFVEAGCLYVPEISFHKSIEDYLGTGETADVLLLSGVIQYLNCPYDYLKRMLAGKFKYILIDRTSFTDSDKDRLCVQTVPPLILEGAYPIWLFSLQRMRQFLEKEGYAEIMHWESFDRWPTKIDGRRWVLPSRGFLMERQKEKY